MPVRVSRVTAVLVLTAGVAAAIACSPTQKHTSSPSEPQRGDAGEPEAELTAMVVGTIDKDHFTQKDYAFSKIGDAFDAFKPDLVLVQIRPEAFRKNEYEDGPVEMTYVHIVSGSRGVDEEPIDWYREADMAAPPLQPDPENADLLKKEAGWLDQMEQPFTFEQANSPDNTLKVAAALDARARFLKGDPIFARRAAWMKYYADDAMKKHKPHRVAAFVNFQFRPTFEAYFRMRGAVVKNPVDVVKAATETREPGAVPAPVVTEWKRGLDRLRDKLDRLGRKASKEEKAPLLAKMAIWEVAVDKAGICCVPPSLLLPKDQQAR